MPLVGARRVSFPKPLLLQDFSAASQSAQLEPTFSSAYKQRNSPQETHPAGFQKHGLEVVRTSSLSFMEISPALPKQDVLAVSSALVSKGQCHLQLMHINVYGNIFYIYLYTYSTDTHAHKRTHTDDADHYNPVVQLTARYTKLTGLVKTISA